MAPVDWGYWRQCWSLWFHPTRVTARSEQKSMSHSSWKIVGEVPAARSGEIEYQQPHRRQRVQESGKLHISLAPLLYPQFVLIIFDRHIGGPWPIKNEVGMSPCISACEGNRRNKRHRAFLAVKIADSSVCLLPSCLPSRNRNIHLEKIWLWRVTTDRVPWKSNAHLKIWQCYRGKSILLESPGWPMTWYTDSSIPWAKTKLKWGIGEVLALSQGARCELLPQGSIPGVSSALQGALLHAEYHPGGFMFTAATMQVKCKPGEILWINLFQAVSRRRGLCSPAVCKASKGSAAGRVVLLSAVQPLPSSSSETCCHT